MFLLGFNILSGRHYPLHQLGNCSTDSNPYPLQQLYLRLLSGATRYPWMPRLLRVLCIPRIPLSGNLSTVDTSTCIAIARFHLGLGPMSAIPVLSFEGERIWFSRAPGTRAVRPCSNRDRE